MDFDTAWDVDSHQDSYESISRWEFRKAFLIANKNKYPRDRLLVLAHIFMNIEFEGCRYPKPTMNLIEYLSKGFIDDLKNKYDLKTTVTDSNAAETKDNENAQTCTTSNLKNNQPPYKKMRYTTPYDTSCIIPGFMLKTSKVGTAYDILQQSCHFSRIAKPEIEFEHLSNQHVRAKLYLQSKLIAVADSSSEKMAHRKVTSIAYDILKEMCFTIKVKEINKLFQISLSDIVKDSTIKVSKHPTEYDKISDNNVGNIMLKNMGWKEGDGLGKNNQGIKSPVEVIIQEKRCGLGIAKCKTSRIDLKDFQRQTKKYIMRFLDGPKQKLLFSNEFTIDERKIIHSVCTNIGLKAKSYGKHANRQLVVSKSEIPQNIFHDLSNCRFYENDFYKLEKPRHESN